MSTIWIINQYTATPATGTPGRHPHLARELAFRGHRVYVIAARWHHLLRDADASEAAPEIEDVEGFKFVRVAMPRYADAHDKRRMLNWLLFAWRVAKIDRVIKDKPEVILCSSPSLFATLGAERLARKFGARLVFEVRDIWPLTLVEVGGKSPLHPLLRVMQWIEDRAYRKADRVVSNLPGAVEHMVGRGMDREKFSWIPNGFSALDFDRRQPVEKELLARIPTGKFVVGYAGTLGAANSLNTFLDAAELLRDRDGIIFVLLGQGREKAALVASAAKRNLTNVLFLPPIPKDQVQSALERFDVCSIGLRADSLFRFGVSPNKLFDYLIAGKPIIYGIDSGEYQPIKEFSAGLQVPPQDAAALADAILRLHSLPAEERLLIGENGRRAALEHHEYRMLAEKLEKVLLG
ncbi:glycosyltransferase WbuB [Sphingomonas koreensis]|nr:glycosyltransferase WbuB [Sphingomonas koreensis]